MTDVSSDDRFDPCAGGHPPFTYEENGETTCRRCGRVLDMTPCECHAPLALAFCPVRWRLGTKYEPYDPADSWRW